MAKQSKKSKREVYVVTLDPDVAAHFRTDKEVNEALRFVKKIQQLLGRKKKTV